MYCMYLGTTVQVRQYRYDSTGTVVGTAGRKFFRLEDTVDMSGHLVIRTSSPPIRYSFSSARDDYCLLP